ncbi:MAG: ribulose-phosphate 3-epimerase [Terriglobia bacterium]
MNIVPALLTDDQAFLERQIRQVEVFTDRAQIDFMDGLFVPTTSISPEELASIRTSLDLNAHIMVEEPESYLARLAGSVSEIIFHLEAADDPERTVSAIRAAGLKASIAVNPETPFGRVVEMLEGLESVLFLSVHPGRSGTSFIPAVLDSVRSFKKQNPKAQVGLDGGIKISNCVEIRDAGVDTAYVGSGLMADPDPAGMYRKFLTLIN